MKLLKMAVIVMLLSAAASAQFLDSVAVTIDSAGTNSAQVDKKERQLISVTFPATMTSDTLFIQHRQKSNGPWLDAYYTDTGGDIVRAHILVQANATVALHPKMTFYLLRYIRFVADDAEADDRTLTVYYGSF